MILDGALRVRFVALGRGKGRPGLGIGYKGENEVWRGFSSVLCVWRRKDGAIRVGTYNYP